MFEFLSRFKTITYLNLGREGQGVDLQEGVASRGAGPEEETESDQGVVLVTNLDKRPEKRPGAGQGAETKLGPEADLEERTRSSRRACPENVPRTKRPKRPRTTLKTSPKVLKRTVLELKAKAKHPRGTITKFQLSCKRVSFFEPCAL